MVCYDGSLRQKLILPRVVPSVRRAPRPEPMKYAPKAPVALEEHLNFFTRKG